MAKDPYVYPGSGVLRNNLEIHDQQELSRAEADATSSCSNAVATPMSSFLSAIKSFTSSISSFITC